LVCPALEQHRDRTVTPGIETPTIDET